VSINDTPKPGSSANIFHHFPNKQALYLAAIASACETFRGELGKAADETDAGGHRLRAIAGRHLAQLVGDPDSARLIQREVLAGDKGQDRARIAGIRTRTLACSLTRRMEQPADAARGRRSRAGALVIAR
jgi:AcrR family transcriptional regulator